jgi:hypothetical protein
MNILNNKKEKEKRLKEFEEKYNTKFVGGWILVENKPFNIINKLIGNFHSICIVKFMDDNEIVNKFNKKYESMFTKLNSDVSHEREQIPVVIIIDRKSVV